MPSDCPTRKELLQYTLGRLSEVESDQIYQHLEQCSACEEAVRQLDDQADEAVQRLRRQPESQAADDTEYQQAAAEALKMHAGADGGDSDAATVEYRPIQPTLRGDRYHLKKFHAKGGMGEVWLAVDKEIGRQVAVKRLRDRVSDYRERFLAEAQITGQLEHPAIVPVHDLGLDQEGNTFYVMKFVRGRTLKDAIQDYYAGQQPNDAQRQVEWSRLLQHFLNVCHAVAYAHSQGVIHRDLKPDNVMLGPYSETLLLDWGLAKIVAQPDAPGGLSDVVTKSRTSDETQGGSVIGAAPYMAPELAEGRAAEAGPATDVYLLGATLYHILTGQPPRRGSSRSEMVELARTVPPPPPRQVNSRTPRALDWICTKAMAHREQDRYQSATELADDIQRHLAGEPPADYPEPMLDRAWRWTNRHRRGLARSAAAVLILGLALTASSLALERTAHRRVEEFQEKVGRAWFYAVNSQPDEDAPNAPYYDPAKGVEAANEALAIYDAWGRSIMLDETQRSELRRDASGLVMLLTQAQADDLEADQAEQLLARLEETSSDQEPSQSYYRLRANLLDALGDATQAAQTRAQIAEAPQTALDYFLQGESYRTQSAHASKELERRDLLENAAAEYKAAIAEDPRNYWAYYQLGRAYLGLGRKSEAVATLDTCIALRPDAEWGHSVRGLAQALSRDFSDAMPNLREATSLSNGVGTAELNLGIAYLLQDQLDEARETFQSVLDRTPPETRLVEAAFYLGEIDRRQGKLKEALDNYQLVTKERPGFRQAWLRLATLLFLADKDEEGMAAVDQYVAQSSLTADIAAKYEARGTALRRVAGSLKGAKRDALLVSAAEELQKAVDKEETADRLDELAEILMVPRPIDEKAAMKARGICSKGLEVEPSHIGLLCTRARAHEVLEEKEKAAEDYVRAAEAESKTLYDRFQRADARFWVGYYKAKENKAEDALLEAALAEGAIDELTAEQKKDHFILHHNLAGLYAELSKFDELRRKKYEDVAIRYLEKAIDLAKRAGRIQYEINAIKHGEDYPQSLWDREEFKALHPDLRSRN